MFFSQQQLLMNSKATDKWSATYFPAIQDWVSSVDTNNGVTILSSEQTGRIFRSTDGCVTFTQQQFTGNFWRTLEGPAGSFFSQQWAVYGSNGGVGSQALSTDNGLTWTTKNFTANNGATFSTPTESAVMGSFYFVVGDSGMISSSVSGDQSPTYGVPALNRFHVGPVLANDGYIVLFDNMQTSHYKYAFSNPSITGTYTTPFNNIGHATNGAGGIMVMTRTSTQQIATAPDSVTAPTTFTIPAGIHQGRFPQKTYYNPARNEYVVMGNNQGLPSPLCLITPDFVNWTDISAGINASNNIGAINDCVWDSTFNQYIFAVTPRQMFTTGLMIVTYKP